MNNHEKLITQCEEWLEITNKTNCSDLHEFVSEVKDCIEQLVKERDAAFDDIPHQCFYCKKAISCGEIKGTCKEWEWRGLHD